MENNKSILLSAVQPTGSLTIGNYLSVLSKWNTMQQEYNCIYCIADLHAITVKNESKVLRKNIFDTLSLYLACGVDPKKSIIFVQSHVYEHAQLNWILNCYSYFGELTRMTQFKSKFKNVNKNINVALFNYPILMASDILLYQTNHVLVGLDQKQHLELVIDIANRFNTIYGKKVFTIPSVLLSQQGSKIMSLLEPVKKMSKSNVNKNNSIFLLEKIDSIRKKIKKSVTDSEQPAKIYYNIEKKPGISNLLTIFSCITGKTIFELEKEFAGKLYGEFKESLFDALSTLILKIQRSYSLYRKDESYLEKIMIKGALQARKYARRTLKNVYDVLGLR
ncbi:tryptophan--tRNA ligase [Buchnera aphidicola (Pemphigus obesinymphae)]|uniref:tryptophan--tRNA ligase n=1 Tax=Buchnera aphidicola TaxID=9 RepID=UPI00223794BC|nr:tryptophan--tRNA ligase [Buchnera aphidicola]MCW5196432.1 tryptophan--tRNA ligase [Buchnera aphidicola (Pemphigus obesinymphae)]